MAYAEVSFKVNTEGIYQDGMPISIKGSGMLISPAELTDWVQNSVQPPNFSMLPENVQDQVERRVLQVKYLTTPGLTPAQAATVRFGATTRTNPMSCYGHSTSPIHD